MNFDAGTLVHDYEPEPVGALDAMTLDRMRDPCNAPSAMSARSIARAEALRVEAEDRRRHRRIVSGTVLLLAALAAVCLLFAGCSSAQLKADEAALKSDVYASATMVRGLVAHAATAAAANPQVVIMLGAAMSDLASRAGLSAADAALLKTEVTPANVAALAPKVDAVAARVQAISAP